MTYKKVGTVKKIYHKGWKKPIYEIKGVIKNEYN